MLAVDQVLKSNLLRIYTLSCYLQEARREFMHEFFMFPLSERLHSLILVLPVQMSSLNYLHRMFNVLYKSSFIIYKRIGNRIFTFVSTVSTHPESGQYFHYEQACAGYGPHSGRRHIDLSEWKINTNHSTCWTVSIMSVSQRFPEFWRQFF